MGEKLRKWNYSLTRCLLGECLLLDVVMTEMAKGEHCYPRGLPG